MTTGKKYQVEKTSPTSYMGELDQVINGYSVRVRLFEFDELHDLKVPDIAETTVKDAIEKLLSEREAVAELG